MGGDGLCVCVCVCVLGIALHTVIKYQFRDTVANYEYLEIFSGRISTVMSPAIYIAFLLVEKMLVSHSFTR